MLLQMQDGWLDGAGHCSVHLQAVHCGWWGEGAEAEEWANREAVPAERRQATHSIQVRPTIPTREDNNAFVSWFNMKASMPFSPLWLHRALQIYQRIGMHVL